MTKPLKFGTEGRRFPGGLKALTLDDVWKMSVDPCHADKVQNDKEQISKDMENIKIHFGESHGDLIKLG